MNATPSKCSIFKSMSSLNGGNLIQRVVYYSRSEAINDLILTEGPQAKPENGINYPANHTGDFYGTK